MDTWPPVPPYWKLFNADSAFSPPAPPPLPDDESKTITMFGTVYNTDLTMPALSEAGVQQLFDDNDVLGGFRRLNESLLVQYLDLVRGMRQVSMLAPQLKQQG
jgi:hypothetical protein